MGSPLSQRKRDVFFVPGELGWSLCEVRSPGRRERQERCDFAADALRKLRVGSCFYGKLHWFISGLTMAYGRYNYN